jgi:pantetheine-phosphate adenylyltransferase
MQKKFKTVAVGGTFDELHKGHRALLVKAFEVGEHVVIGLCSDSFVRKLSKPHVTASYDQRLEELKTFLHANGFSERAEIFPLDDPFGITLSNGGVEALIVSKETEPTALQINKKRAEAERTPLQIIAISMVPSENHIPISTTRIRRGEIDREGHLLKT